MLLYICSGDLKLDDEEDALVVQTSRSGFVGILIRLCGLRRLCGLGSLFGLSRLAQLTAQGKVSLVILALLIPASTAAVFSKHGLRLPQLPAPDLLTASVCSWGRRCGWGIDAAVQLVNAVTGVAFLWSFICILARLKDNNRKAIGREVLFLLFLPLLILFIGRYLVSLM